MYWSQPHHSSIFLAALGLQWPRIQTGTPRAHKAGNSPYLVVCSFRENTSAWSWLGMELGQLSHSWQPTSHAVRPSPPRRAPRGESSGPHPQTEHRPRPPGSFRTDLSPAGTRALGGPQASCPLPRLGPPPQTRAQRTRRPHPQVSGDQVGSGGIGSGWLFHLEPGPGPHGATSRAAVVVDRRVFIRMPPTVRVSWPPGPPSWGADPPSGGAPAAAPTIRPALCFPKSSRCGHTGDVASPCSSVPGGEGCVSSASSGCLVHWACGQGHRRQTHTHTARDQRPRGLGPESLGGPCGGGWRGVSEPTCRVGRSCAWSKVAGPPPITGPALPGAPSPSGQRPALSFRFQPADPRTRGMPAVFVSSSRR